MLSEIRIAIPSWVSEEARAGEIYALDAERMALAVRLSERNVEQGGGPFGAVVFESHSGRVVALGVNLVLQASTAIAHAEMVALAAAQQTLGELELGRAKGAPYELFTSCEPCTMCLGAVHWSGIGRLVCAARDEDATDVGFDEGPKPDDWPRTLEARGVRVERDMDRGEAVAVLQRYGAEGRPLYNPTRGPAMRRTDSRG